MYGTPTERDLDKRVTELEDLLALIRPELEKLREQQKLVNKNGNGN